MIAVDRDGDVGAGGGGDGEDDRLHPVPWRGRPMEHEYHDHCRPVGTRSTYVGDRYGVERTPPTTASRRQHACVVAIISVFGDGETRRTPALQVLHAPERRPLLVTDPYCDAVVDMRRCATADE